VQTRFLYDSLGSTAQLTDGAGAVAGAYAYDVFGSVRSHTGSNTEWTFTGEQNDPTGLEYLRARYYDPTAGRFMGRDPFMGLTNNPQSLNRYTYALNSPVNLRDPSGMQGEATVAAGGGGLVCVFVSGGTCAVIVGGGTAVALCYASPACRAAMGGAGGAVVEGVQNVGEAVGDAKDWVGGLFSKGHSKPAEPNFTPWYPSSSQPGQIFPPGSQPPSGGMGKWMYRAIVAGMIAYAAEQSGILNMCVPPKESKEMR